MTETPAPAKKGHRPYLHEVDLMRVIFIGGVLLNHTTTAFQTNMSSTSGQRLGLLATHLMIHFTRMGFMFMTGLVLALAYFSKDIHWPVFYLKRFKTVTVPYVLWNTILLVGATALGVGAFTWAAFGSTYLSALLHGDQFYLYYLMVTMQLYLAFPLLRLLFKKTAHHGRILLISFVAQLAIVSFIKYGLPTINTSNWLWWFKAYGVNVVTYQFYFIAGTYTMLHYQQIVDFIDQHIRVIASLTAALSIGTIGLYAFNRLVLGLNHTAAVSPHQPYMVVYDGLMIMTVFWLGRRYAQWRQTTQHCGLDQLIQNGAKVSFGIYLCQTIAVSLLSGILGQLHLSDTALLLLLPLGYAFVLGLSFLIAWFCYRVPPFGWLIGRPQPWHAGKKGVLHYEHTHRSSVSATDQ
ncbi:MAG: acyltransferase [Schleiferilactobacillus harbinensis]